MLLQFLFVFVAIIIGARLGGIGLGVLGGLGLAVLTFVFGLEPTSPPIDVMLMIVAVISAASCMQAAGGLDLMVKWAEKLLRKNPSQITLLSPLPFYVHCRDRPRRLLYPSRHCRSSNRNENPPRAPVRHRRHRFTTGNHRQPYLCRDRRNAQLVSRIQNLIA